MAAVLLAPQLVPLQKGGTLFSGLNQHHDGNMHEEKLLYDMLHFIEVCFIGDVVH